MGLTSNVNLTRHVKTHHLRARLVRRLALVRHLGGFYWPGYRDHRLKSRRGLSIATALGAGIFYRCDHPPSGSGSAYCHWFGEKPGANPGRKIQYYPGAQDLRHPVCGGCHGLCSLSGREHPRSGCGIGNYDQHSASLADDLCGCRLRRFALER